MHDGAAAAGAIIRRAAACAWEQRRATWCASVQSSASSVSSRSGCGRLPPAAGDDDVRDRQLAEGRADRRAVGDVAGPASAGGPELDGEALEPVGAERAMRATRRPRATSVRATRGRCRPWRR